MVEKETVVVDNSERRSHSGWIIALIVLALIVLFYIFGGFSMFSGQAGTGADVTVPTPTTGTGQ